MTVVKAFIKMDGKANSYTIWQWLYWRKLFNVLTNVRRCVHCYALEIPMTRLAWFGNSFQSRHLLVTNSVATGALVDLSPQTKLQAPQIEMWNINGFFVKF